MSYDPSAAGSEPAAGGPSRSATSRDQAAGTTPCAARARFVCFNVFHQPHTARAAESVGWRAADAAAGLGAALDALRACDGAASRRRLARRRFEDQLFRGNRLLDARKCAAAAREFADARATGPDERADLRDPVLARIWREVLEFKDELLASCDEAPEL